MTSSTRQLFEMDALSGWISVSRNVSGGSLDYEFMSTYRLVVSARNAALDSESSSSAAAVVYAAVLIHLDDANDNAPVIRVVNADDTDTSTSVNVNVNETSVVVSEWSMEETFVVQLAVSDADAAAGSQLSLTMSETRRKTNSSSSVEEEKSDDFALVHLFNNMYAVMVARGHSLDREQHDAYELRVLATDDGHRTAGLLVRLAVADENDNRPHFRLTGTNLTTVADDDYLLDLVESTSTTTTSDKDKDEWTRVAQVDAWDADAGDNALLVHSLHLVASCNDIVETSSLLRVNATSGAIEARLGSLDRESCASYEWRVEVSDRGRPQALAALHAARLRLNVADLNDNRPVFEQPLYTFKLFESSSSRRRRQHLHLASSEYQLIGRVRASDADVGPAATLRYELIMDDDDNDDKFNNNNNTTALFRVDATSGDLLAALGDARLDYEARSSYELVVRVSDNGNGTSPSLSATCVVRVELLDVNDNRPRLLEPVDATLPLAFELDALVAAYVNSSHLSTMSGGEEEEVQNKSDAAAADNVHHLNQMIRLFRVNASDRDSELNGRIAYRLVRQMRLRQLAALLLDDDDKAHDYDEFNDEAEEIEQEDDDDNDDESEDESLFEIDANTGVVSLRLNLSSTTALGIYALVVRLTDLADQQNGASSSSSSSKSLASNAYYFVVLTSSHASNSSSSPPAATLMQTNQTGVLNASAQVQLLAQLIASHGLNDQPSASTSTSTSVPTVESEFSDDDEADDEEEEEDAKEARFATVVRLYRTWLVQRDSSSSKTTKSKTTRKSTSVAAGSSSSNSNNAIMRLKNRILSALSGDTSKNSAHNTSSSYKLFLLVLVVAVVVFLLVLVGMLVVLGALCVCARRRHRRDHKQQQQHTPHHHHHHHRHAATGSASKKKASGKSRLASDASDPARSSLTSSSACDSSSSYSSTSPHSSSSSLTKTSTTSTTTATNSSGQTKQQQQQQQQQPLTVMATLAARKAGGHKCASLVVSSLALGETTTTNATSSASSSATSPNNNNNNNSTGNQAPAPTAGYYTTRLDYEELITATASPRARLIQQHQHQQQQQHHIHELSSSSPQSSQSSSAGKYSFKYDRIYSDDFIDSAAVAATAPPPPRLVATENAFVDEPAYSSIFKVCQNMSDINNYSYKDSFCNNVLFFLFANRKWQHMVSRCRRATNGCRFIILLRLLTTNSSSISCRLPN